MVNFPNANLTDEERQARNAEAGKRFQRRNAERKRNTELGMARRLFASTLSGRKKVKNIRNKQCPCGSGKKYKKCHGGVGDNGDLLR